MTDRWPLSAFGDEIDPSLEAQVDALQASEVAAVELRSAWGTNVVDMDGEQLARAAGVLRDGGIAVSAIGSPIGKAPIDGDFEVERARLRQAIHAAEQLDTRLIRVFSFYVESQYAQHRDEVLRRMAAMTRDAEAAGLVLVHENESYIYGDLPERCRDMLESVGSPALRMAFDPANFVQCGARPMADAWPLLSEYVTHVHIKDAIRVDRTGLDPYPAPVPGDRLMPSVRPAGQGDGEVPQLIAELDRRGYEGYLTLEPHLGQTLPDLNGRGRFEVAVAALRGLLEQVPGRA